MLWDFKVKYYVRRRARLVAGGNVKNDLDYDINSGKVGMETVRIEFLARGLHDLYMIYVDVASACLKVLT